MGRRFLGLAAALGLILLAAFNLQSETATILHVFFWLFLVLVVSGVTLWPSTGRDQRAELRLERPSWADRIDFKAGTTGTRPSPAPGKISRAG
jgi:hypothetical protein